MKDEWISYWWCLKLSLYVVFFWYDYMYFKYWENYVILRLIMIIFVLIGMVDVIGLSVNFEKILICYKFNILIGL